MKTFVVNKEQMLVLGLTSRNASRAASDIIGIESEIVAWDFDNAVTLRLLIYDNEKEFERFRVLGQMLGGDASSTSLPSTDYSVDESS